MIKKNVLLCSILFVLSLGLSAQKIDITAPIPVDPAIKKGILKNGLSYYIKHNKQPEKRLELRLAVNAGSMQENQSQVGLAHFCEHMCFNGTKAFPKADLVNFLEKMGIEFGAELNAYTSFDETVYILSVPADRPGLVDTAMMVLHEWSQNVSFDNKEIDKERGVVISEWRLGLGASDRMRKQYWPVLLKGSRYAERMPIGTKENLDAFPYDTVKQFYHDWYRPDLMAVSVVGDVNADTLEHLVKKYFESSVNPVKERPRLDYEIPDNKEPLVSVTTDKEFPYSIVQMFYKLPHKVQKTVGDYKSLLLNSLFNGMINSRYEEIMHKPDAPFIEAGSEYSEFMGRTKDSYSSTAVAKENKVKESLTKMVEVNNQLKAFGFTQGELDREKKEILSMYEKMAQEKNKTESKSLVEEYIRNFLTQEPIPGIDNEYEYAKQMLPSITVDELNALAKTWITEENVVFIVMLPQNDKIIVPSSKEILDTYNAAKGIKSEKYVDSYVEKPLVDKNLSSVKVTKRVENKTFGYTEITLANGAKLILKPNNWKNDEILFLGISPGGQSLCNDNDVYTARTTSDLINASGLGEFDDVSLQKKMSGNTANLHSNIALENESLKGEASPKDFGTLLQLNYLYFTAPRIDEESYKTYISKKITDLSFQKSNPKAIFSDTLFKILYSNNNRFTLMNDTSIYHSIDKAKALAFDKQRFGNAADFTFIVVGSFKVDSLLPSLQTWIGNLPSSSATEKAKYLQPEFPKGQTNVVVKKGLEPQSTVFMQINNPTVWDRKELLTLNYLVEILNIKLRESMREDQGRVYGVRAREVVQKNPKTVCALKLSFGCAPESVDTLFLTIKGEMQRLIDNGPVAVDVEKIREQKIRSLENSVKKNNYWLSVLETQVTGDFDVESYDTTLARIKSITADDIKVAAKKYFNSADMLKAVLLPETVK
jgi:zinc protease